MGIRGVSVLLAFLVIGPSAEATPAQEFQQAEKRLAVLEKAVAYRKDLKLPRLFPRIRQAMKTAKSISEIYDKIHKNKNVPASNSRNALCRAGVPLAIVAEAIHEMLLKVPVPKKVLRLGASAVRIYKEQVRLLITEQSTPLDDGAAGFFQACLKTKKNTKFRKRSALLFAKAAKRKSTYVAWRAAAGQTPTSRPSSRSAPRRARAKSNSWWYTRCRALNIVTDGFVPTLKECVALVTAEVRRLTKAADKDASRRKWAKAVRTYTRALALDPDWARARKGRALANTAQGRTRKVLEDVRWWRQRFGEDSSKNTLEREIAVIRNQRRTGK